MRNFVKKKKESQKETKFMFRVSNRVKINKNGCIKKFGVMT